MADSDKKGVVVVVVTGMLALLGTVAGGIVEGYWQREIKLQEFQSDLILRALEPESDDDRKQSLQFLVDSGLIVDAGMAARLSSILEDEEASLPRFGEPTVARSVGGAASAKGDAGLADDEAAGEFFALSGLIVRHGDIIDAVTPIFTKVSVKGEYGEPQTGKQYGGDGGGVTRLEKPGYLISEIRLIRGSYFGARHVIHIEVLWRKLGRDGLDPKTEVASKRLGGGSYAKGLESPIVYKAEDGAYISDLFVPPSLRHTSGELYLTDLVAEYKPIPGL